MSESIKIACVGDLILDEPGPVEQYFEGTKDILRQQDVLIGQVETPHTTVEHYFPSCVDIQAPPSNPEHLDCLPGMGFNIATVAGNHTYDCGPLAVIDTVARLKALGVIPVGAGANISEAKVPAIVERKGIKVGVLDYNCTGPSFGWATSQKPGTNYIKVQTSYTAAHDMPGCSVKTYTFVLPEDLRAFQAEVEGLRAQVDILVVVFHKGNGGDRPALNAYERQISYAAIDAGADIIFAHHHHVLKAVEFYKNKPIYHGLGNYVCVTYAMTAGHNLSPEMVAYLEQRGREGRGDGHYEVDFYPWSRLSRYTMIAQVEATDNMLVRCGFIPCYIEKSGNIVARSKENGGQEIVDFVIKQTRGANIDVTFEWSEDGDVVYISPA